MNELNLLLAVLSALFLGAGGGLAIWVWRLRRITHPKAIAAAETAARKQGMDEALTTVPMGEEVAPGSRADITTADLEKLKTHYGNEIKDAVKQEQEKHARTYNENRKWRALDWARKNWPWEQFDEGLRQFLQFCSDQLYHDPGEKAQAAVAQLQPTLDRFHPPHKAPNPPKGKDELLCFIGGEHEGFEYVRSIHNTELWRSLVVQLWRSYQIPGRLDTLRPKGLLDEGGESGTGMGDLNAGASAAPAKTAKKEDNETPGVGY